MSTVVGLRCNGKTYLGADSQYTNEHGVASYGAKKIHRVGGMLIGSIGAAMPGIQSRYLEIPTVTAPRKFMATKFPQIVREFMEEYGTDEEFEWLIAFRGALYNLDSTNYECVPCNHYHAVGTGAQFALATLYTNHRNAHCEDKIRYAIEVARHFDTYTGGKIVVECL